MRAGADDADAAVLQREHDILVDAIAAGVDEDGRTDKHGVKGAAGQSFDVEIGFEAIDAGNLAIARLLEPYGMLWIHLALVQGLGTTFAFALLKR